MQHPFPNIFAHITALYISRVCFKKLGTIGIHRNSQLNSPTFKSSRSYLNASGMYNIDG